MKLGLMAFVSLTALGSFAQTTVSNLTLTQDDPSGAVTVRYDLSGDPAVVTFGGSLAGETLADGIFRRVGGDVNRLIAPGTGHSFVWCPRGADGTVFDISGFIPKLKLWPTNSPPDYMVIDLRPCRSSGPASYDIAYYTSTNALPRPISDRGYKTDWLVMRRIPAKDVVWRMGSPTSETGRVANEETTHEVKLTNDFYIGVYELTDRQATTLNGSLVGSASSYGVRDNVSPYGEMETYPVCGTYFGDLRGSLWPTNLYDQTAGRITTFRKYSGLRLDLPTDAQWEFACRAGESAALYNGQELSSSSQSASLDDIAWYTYNSVVRTAKLGKDFPLPHPVGLKKPNAFGLYDMLGNVSEACLDWYRKITYTGGPDPATTLYVEPIGPDTYVNESTTDGAYMYRRIARGGAYSTVASHCRSAHRHGWNKNYGDGPGYTYVHGETTDAEKKTQRAGLGIRLVCPALAVH